MPRRPLAHQLPHFSVTRPVTVIMMLCAILVLGFIANQRLPVELFPAGMDENQLGIEAEYPNASAKDIEEKIARPIEDMVGTVSGVTRIRSWIRTGRVWVQARFENGADLDTAYADLRDRMDRLIPEMPDDLEEIEVHRWDENDIPIMYLVIDLPDHVEDPAFVMETIVEPTVRRVEGVGNLDSHGFESKEVRVDLIEDRLRSHNIDPNALVTELRNQNFSLSSGHLSEGGNKVYVRSVGRFENIDQIEEIIIDPVHRISLAEVANISYRASERDWAYRIDSEPAIGLEITRESSANIESISREVHATMERLKEHPSLRGMTYSVFWDQGKHVRESIDNLKSTGLWGGGFAALVIFAFLRAPRMTGILTLAIPLSLLCTVITIYFMDWTLNMATMMGLLLSVGLVVDNAIVIVENIYRKRQQGIGRETAAVEGAGEVGLAVTMATLTTVVVFMPLILMNGDAEFTFWMIRIGMPVVIALIASLIIALVFIPLATQRFSRGHHHDEPKSIGWLRQRYTRALQWVLAHRLESGLLVLLAFMTIVIPAGGVKQSGEGGGDENDSFRVYFYPPSGNTLEDTTAFMTTAEQFLLDRREKYNIESVSSSFSKSFCRMEGRFAPKENTEWYQATWHNILVALGKRQNPMSKEDILDDIRKTFELPPGIEMRAGRRGSDQENNRGRVSVVLYGDDTATLIKLSREAQDRIRTIPETLSVETTLDRDGEELRVVINRERARELGISPWDVSSTIASSLRGREIGRFYTPDGRDVRIQVQLEDAEEQDLADLKAMTFYTESGREIPLESVAHLEFDKTLNFFMRTDRKTTLTVTAVSDPKNATKVFHEIDNVMEGFEMPAGYRWDKGVRFTRLQESNDAMKFAMILSVTLVFLLMGVLFESFILPLAVIIAVPFSFLGVWWTLFITRTDMSMMAMIGMVILIGVVVNNAIVLVDLTNRLRESGMERVAALTQAGQHRLRPILMTTCTTICGLIPMALGNSAMIGMPYSPMGRAMIGGLAFSTVLTLLIVPLFYLMLDDLRNWAANVARSALGGTSHPTSKKVEV
jgi:HAE1 family hydrophobic/amphiphilic exporter-1